MKSIIPLYNLNHISERHFVVERIQPESKIEDLSEKGIHRDSHYIFTVMESGHVKIMVDFNIIEVQEPVVFYVLPGQVHQGLLMENVSAWFVAVKTDYIDDSIRSVLEGAFIDIKPLAIDKEQIRHFNAIAGLLRDYYTDPMFDSKYAFFILQSLLNAFTGSFAKLYLVEKPGENSGKNRALQLTKDFRILARNHFKTLKSPSLYADLLNITRGYLTEVVKETTGKSAQYWIHQEILMEAKRLLVFTNLSIKEIAYKLGYSDYAYFTRLFSKSESLSPSEFREKNIK